MTTRADDRLDEIQEKLAELEASPRAAVPMFQIRYDGLRKLEAHLMLASSRREQPTDSCGAAPRRKPRASGRRVRTRPA